MKKGFCAGRGVSPRLTKVSQKSLGGVGMTVLSGFGGRTGGTRAGECGGEGSDKKFKNFQAAECIPRARVERAETPDGEPGRQRRAAQKGMTKILQNGERRLRAREP